MNSRKELLLKEIEQLSAKLTAAQLKEIIEELKNHRATYTNAGSLCSQLQRK